MITADPARRAARLAEILELLQEKASVDDRELLQAFAPLAFGEMPDHSALEFPA